ncbi:MAG TPA: hypothetical protein VF848_00035 [Steroidobacteraceae bacterium]
MSGDETTGTTPVEPRPGSAGPAPPPRRVPDGHLGRFVVKLSLGVVAFSLAWLAYIDAPITDLCLLVLALAVLCSLVAATAGFAIERCDDQWPGPEADAVTIAQLQRSRLRRSRLAVTFLLIAYALAALSCGLALNLRGYGNDSSEQQTVRTAQPL